jgi:hypothetical protein
VDGRQRAQENMSKAAKEYEARVCDKQAGVGYNVNGVQFDGFDEATGHLVDAKQFADSWTKLIEKRI